jgi:hypothetical protein
LGYIQRIFTWLFKELAMNFRTHSAAVFLALCLSCYSSGQDAAAASSVAGVPDGTVLALGDSCYTITAKQDGKEQPVGLVFQSIQRQEVNGIDALAVIVH